MKDWIIDGPRIRYMDLLTNADCICPKGIIEIQLSENIIVPMHLIKEFLSS